jgi:hypothetical protein
LSVRQALSAVEDVAADALFTQPVYDAGQRKALRALKTSRSDRSEIA